MENLVEHGANAEYEGAVGDDGIPTKAWPMPSAADFDTFKAKKLQEDKAIFDKKKVVKNKLGEYLVARCGEKPWEESDEYKEYINFEWVRRQKVSLSDFTEFRLLGRGGFGMVKGVRRNCSGSMFANKIQNKERMKAGKAVGLAFEERKSLQSVLSDFVVKMHYAFHDKENVYIILELLTGGDLQFHLKEQGKFTEDVAMYLLAGTLQGIGALHDSGWVYRDLKPENILLSAEGHVKVTDLGLATKLGDGIKGGAGTAGYTAPEIITAKDENGNYKLYDERCDFWSFGCLAFAFFDGQSPFYKLHASVGFDPKDHGKDKKKAIEEATKAMVIEYNQNFTAQATELCQALLERDPDKRLGACLDDDSEGWRDIEKHAFFDGFSFDKLRDGSMKPPFQPDGALNVESMEEIGDHDEKKGGQWSEADEKKFKNWNHMSKELFYEEVVANLKWAEDNGDLRAKAGTKKSSACSVM